MRALGGGESGNKAIIIIGIHCHSIAIASPYLLAKGRR